jgi:hypothetical protein
VAMRAAAPPPPRADARRVSLVPARHKEAICCCSYFFSKANWYFFKNRIGHQIDQFFLGLNIIFALFIIFSF